MRGLEKDGWDACRVCDEGTSPTSARDNCRCLSPCPSDSYGRYDALLETFGSYDRAWLFLTRHLPIPVDKVGDHFQEILDKAEELPEARCRSWRISSGVFGR